MSRVQRILMAELMAKLTKGQKRFATVALTFCAVYFVLFSIAQYVSFLITGTEQEQLIEMTFTVLGVEVGGLLVKRVADKIFDKRKNEEE